MIDTNIHVLFLTNFFSNNLKRRQKLFTKLKRVLTDSGLINKVFLDRRNLISTKLFSNFEKICHHDIIHITFHRDVSVLNKQYAYSPRLAYNIDYFDDGAPLESSKVIDRSLKK